MTIPTNYEKIKKIEGNSSIAEYTFQVILQRNTEETIGPVTNSRKVGMLHPDRHDNSQDRGRLASNNHETQYTSFLPGFLAGTNIIRRNNDGSFVVSGTEAIYLRETYVDVPNPLLKIIG